MSANLRYLRALSFAAERHDAVAQPRKGTSFPYVIHPIRVAGLLDRHRYPEHVVVAGFLHDVVEDTETTVDYERRGRQPLLRQAARELATLADELRRASGDRTATEGLPLIDIIESR